MIEVDVQGFTAAVAARAGMARTAAAEGTLTAAQAVAELSSGWVLARWHAKWTQTPSSPGTPPASITFALGDSIRARPAADPRGPAAEAFSDVEYAPYQEFGTSARGTGRPGESVSPGLPPRPFLAPAVDQLQDTIAAVIAAELAVLGG